MMMGTLFLVATPIGNLEDITARALRILTEVSLIAAEDTRRTRKLLHQYAIQTPLTSYHEHNKIEKLAEVLKALEHSDVALVSDAGTPALNDPGYELVRAVIEAGSPVSPVPGPSAPIAALVASGLPTDAFLYMGYLPRKRNARRRALAGLEALPYTLIFLEAPHRLLAALEDIAATLGERQLAVARELTKLHEEIVRGPPGAAHSHFSVYPPKGEITLVVSGNLPETEQVWDEAQVRAALENHLQTDTPPSQIAKKVAETSGWDRRVVYRMLADLTGPEP
jgi:16S rRNA (cytidine1402-2'-O)-methyltransferase